MEIKKKTGTEQCIQRQYSLCGRTACMRDRQIVKKPTTLLLFLHKNSDLKALLQINYFNAQSSSRSESITDDFFGSNG